MIIFSRPMIPNIVLAFCVSIISIIFCSCRDTSLKNYRAEQVNPCKYFKLKFDEKNGKLGSGFTWREIEVDHDNLSNFIGEHKQRFMYIVINKCGDLSKYFQMFPDTAKINAMFCDDLQNKQFLSYFLSLCNLKNPADTSAQQVFSLQEVTHVAARYFYLEESNRTVPGKGIQYGLTYHAGCVGINGLKDLKASRDYSVVEAFTFEAIMSSYSKRHSHIIRNFEKYIDESLKVKRDTTIDFHTAVDRLRHKLYGLMENDVALRNEILQFYKRNADNVGFVINK